MNLETIQTESNWGTESGRLNRNFQRLTIETEKANNASIRYKGLFETIHTLKSAYPSPIKGDWAVIGNTIPGPIYVCKTNGLWIDTGETGGGGDVNLAPYLKSTKITDITEIL